MSRTAKDVALALDGPVSSIPTTFLPGGALDWDGIARVIETSVAGGASATVLTNGDSQFDFLSDDEAAQLARFLVERTAGRALTIAAAKPWWTGKAVEFARFCKDIGVDAVMVLPSQQATAPEGLIAHYRAVAAVMPVMLVGAPEYSVLDGLTDEPNICCFKEDGTESYAIHTMQRYPESWKFMTGGSLWRHYTQWPYGCRAFFCCYSSFRPEIGQRYWQAVQAGDEKTVSDILTRVDIPFFGLHEEFAGGIQAVWRAALELNGIASRWLRPPMVTASDAEMEAIRERLSALGLVQRDPNVPEARIAGSV